MCWKEAGPSPLPWHINPPSCCILLKHHRDKPHSFQRVMPSATGYILYHLIWRLSMKASWNTSKSPGRDRTQHVCPHHSCYCYTGPLQLLDIFQKRFKKRKIYFYFGFFLQLSTQRWSFHMIRQLKQLVLHFSLAKLRLLKVFSFRTQGSHLLWNLIEGLFINFLRSKFLLQRKRWHTKSQRGVLLCWNGCLWTQQQLENP